MSITSVVFFHNSVNLLTFHDPISWNPLKFMYLHNILINANSPDAINILYNDHFQEVNHENDSREK